MLADLPGKPKTIGALAALLMSVWAPAFADDPYAVETRKLRGEVSITEQGRFTVKNLDSFDWKECRLEVNPNTATHSFFELDVIKAGAMYVLEARQFATKDGYRFLPETMKPLRFKVACGSRISPINPPSELMVDFGTGGLNDTWNRAEMGDSE